MSLRAQHHFRCVANYSIVQICNFILQFFSTAKNLLYNVIIKNFEHLLGDIWLKFILKLSLILFAVAIICMPIYAVTKSKKATKKEIEPAPIEYLANDKFKIIANLYLPLKLEKNTKIPLVIFVHALGQNKKIWDPYAKELAEKGYSVLAIDLRGHGESVINKKGKKQYWRSFKPEMWKDVASDVTNGIKLLKTDYPQVNTDKTVIIGASMGACVAINAAQAQRSLVKGLVLLSPFACYKGIEARVPLVTYGAHPLLIMVSKADITSYESTKELIKYSQGSHEVVIVKNAGHGTFMLRFEPKLKKIMYDWLAKNLPPTVEQLPVIKGKTKKKSTKIAE